MPKPYALSLYSPPTQATQEFQHSLTSAAKGWKRSIRSNGGAWQGSFRLDGSQRAMQDAFENWLGYEVREKAAGMLSWTGLIYEMDLTTNGVTRRRSLDMTVNRTKTTFTQVVFGGDNFVRSPGFDTAVVTPGANDNFDSWYENNAAAALTIKWDGVVFRSGLASLRLTGDGSDPVDPANAAAIWVRQNINVTPGARYQIKFWTRGDGGAAGAQNYGWFGVRDPNAPEWLWGPQQTFWTTAAWREITVPTVVGPPDGEIMLFFFAPQAAGRIVYFDDVEMLEEGPYVLESSWATLDATGAVVETDPINSPPITRYGVKEEVLHLDSYPTATAFSYRDTYLKENAYPWARPVSAAKRGDSTLEVMVAGYAWTMNWMYLQNHSGVEDTVDAWLRLIVGSTWGRSPEHGGTDANAGDCQFVRAGIIYPNALTTWQTSTVEERPWDVIQELTSLGDGADNLWRSWVGPTRLFHYFPILTAPRYFIRRDGIFDTMAGTMPSNPWLMQPAVFRDLTYRSRLTEVGLFLPDPRDMYVEEVEMADGWDQPSLKTAIYSEADILLNESARGPADSGPSYAYVPGR